MFQLQAVTSKPCCTSDGSVAKVPNRCTNQSLRLMLSRLRWTVCNNPGLRPAMSEAIPLFVHFFGHKSRAVHLKLSFSLSTDGFLNTFIRKAGRRGFPEFVLSNYGANYIGAEREL